MQDYDSLLMRLSATDLIPSTRSHSGHEQASSLGPWLLPEGHEASVTFKWVTNPP